MTSLILTKVLARRCTIARKTLLLQTRYIRYKEGLWYQHFARCYCSSNPKDTVDPPTKRQLRITNTLTSLVDKFERKLQKRTPKVFNVYQTIKNVRLIVADARCYFSVSAQLWQGRELHTFTRRELEIYLDMPQDIIKVSMLLVVFLIPFIGNVLIASMYWYPRTFFTHHLWSPDQKAEFRQHFHKKRLAQYHHILAAVNRQTSRYGPGEEHYDRMMHIIDKMASKGGQPTVEELVQVKDWFEKFPFSLDSLPTSYVRQIAKSSGLSKSVSQLQEDGLVLLHIDRAMVREGIYTMTDDEVCKECLRRGLNPYGITNAERLEFLKLWTDLSKQLDEKNVSLLLHCQTFLTYNSQTNIQLMKGTKYKWHR